MPQTAQQDDTLNVGGAVLTITSGPTLLPDAAIGVAYSFQHTASGGTAPYTWAATAGAFPPGITLDASGLLHGAPQAIGAFHFTVTVTDSGA